MYSARPESPVMLPQHVAGRLRKLSLKLIFAFLSFSLLNTQPVRAQEINMPLITGQAEAWLVTYAPGEIYWQRFGHNAIWIRDPGRGIDHVFNFGFFDFGQENFFQRFIQGRMLYFSAAQPVADEFRQYQVENRSIVAQKLDLEAIEYERLFNHLVQQVQIENRDYLYDYYLDNCSTRVRDAIDVALGGAVRQELASRRAGQNLRAHTRRSVSQDFWYSLALETALALPVDREISRWDEMFLPAVVASEMGQFERGGRALISAEYTVFEADSFQPPETAPHSWWRYLAAGLFITAFFALLGRFAGPVMFQGSVNAWLMISGSGGLVLAYLWLFTNHQAAGPNINLLLLNPMFVLGLWQGLRRLVALLLAAGLVLALVQVLFPAGQYNLDVLMFLLPLNAAAAYWLWRNAELRPG